MLITFIKMKKLSVIRKHPKKLEFCENQGNGNQGKDSLEEQGSLEPQTIFSQWFIFKRSRGCWKRWLSSETMSSVSSSSQRSSTSQKIAEAHLHFLSSRHATAPGMIQLTTAQDRYSALKHDWKPDRAFMAVSQASTESPSSSCPHQRRLSTPLAEPSSSPTRPCAVVEEPSFSRSLW